ncbi:unnamed protein product, partial [Hymenolepis diminuta]
MASPSGIPSGCSHEFCYVCIKRWASTGNRTCPMCRAHFNQIGILPTIAGEIKIIEPLPSDLPHSSHQNSNYFHLSAYEQIGVDLETGAPITDPIFIITNNSELV